MQTDMRDIHWYALIQLGGHPEEDAWSIPGAKSPEEAISYFERNTSSSLELCTNYYDGTADFLLEKRLRSLGAGPGELVEIFYARRSATGEI
jgi:hypothetical protein